MPSLPPARSPRIALVISALGAGGAERVMSGMANDWAQAGWDVVLLTLAGPEIWGIGPDRPMLESLVDELRLGGRADLPGVTARPGGWIDGAGVFVLSSLAEGFPNVLL